MRSRRLILCLILLTLLATCLAAAAKLRATPKYDRVELGMTADEVDEILGQPTVGWITWEFDEGRIMIDYEEKGDKYTCHVVRGKMIVRRGPLQRLAWLAGWR